MLQQALQSALLAGGIAAFVGAMTGALFLAGADPFRLGGGEAASRATRLQVGTFLLSAHVTAAATLWVAPKIGACVAAGLGAGWLGAAAAGVLLLAEAERGLARRALTVLFQAAMGVCLWSPLWAWLRVLKHHHGMAITA